mgnify:CR=1 FL=1
MNADNLFWELSYVALNRGFNGKALQEAYSNKILDVDDKKVLIRYMKGSQKDMDHIKLQVIAIKIKEASK